MKIGWYISICHSKPPTACVGTLEQSRKDQLCCHDNMGYTTLSWQRGLCVTFVATWPVSLSWQCGLCVVVVAKWAMLFCHGDADSAPLSRQHGPCFVDLVQKELERLPIVDYQW